jgi:hypothetical protein
MGAVRAGDGDCLLELAGQVGVEGGLPDVLI